MHKRVNNACKYPRVCPPQPGPAHRGASPRLSPSCRSCHGSPLIIGVADSIVCGARVVIDAGGEGKREYVDAGGRLLAAWRIPRLR
jgi:hypothetical protein